MKLNTLLIDVDLIHSIPGGIQFKYYFKQFCGSNNIKINLIKAANIEQNGKYNLFYETLNNFKTLGEMQQ